MENLFSSNSITGDHIATKFGTCHDSPAVVPCAKSCSDHCISTWMRAKWNFHHIWIVMEKMLVKWAPGLQKAWTWWRHQMETFSVLLALCVGNSPVTGEFPSQRPVTWSFDVFFDLCVNKWLSKQSWGCWCEMPLCPLWRQCNEITLIKLCWWPL